MVLKAFFDNAYDSDAHPMPNVVVVDPQFDAYRDLATSARDGRIGLHLRSAGMAAMKLAQRLEVDAWIVADELDDMSGHDFVRLLADMRGDSKIAMIGGDHTGNADVDSVLTRPISCAELEELLDMPVAERSQRLAGRGISGSWVTLPVSIGAAVVALAVLMVG